MFLFNFNRARGADSRKYGKSNVSIPSKIYGSTELKTVLKFFLQIQASGTQKCSIALTVKRTVKEYRRTYRRREMRTSCCHWIDYNEVSCVVVLVVVEKARFYNWFNLRKAIEFRETDESKPRTRMIFL